MIATDGTMGVNEAVMVEMREIKVKLPVRQLLQLHYAKMTSARSISDVVADALLKYFAAAVAPLEVVQLKPQTV
jgi:hypothetical protein